jgi:hypothetical protein
LNTNNNEISWGGYDISGTHIKPLRDGDDVVTLKFIAKRPQDQWSTSPLWTTNKYAGNNQCVDLSITPTNGIIQVFRMANVTIDEIEGMQIFPNPTDDYVNVKFEVKEFGPVRLSVYGLNGIEYRVVVNDNMPEGNYQYQVSLGNLIPGVYVAVLRKTTNNLSKKIILR